MLVLNKRNDTAQQWIVNLAGSAQAFARPLVSQAHHGSGQGFYSVIQLILLHKNKVSVLSFNCFNSALAWDYTRVYWIISTSFKVSKPKIQEMWEHCGRFAWATDSMWGHIYRLCDSLASTKEVLEDVFGAAADFQRANKNPFKTGTIEKLHHAQSYWVRLDSSQWPKLRPNSHDFVTTRAAPHKGMWTLVHSLLPQKFQKGIG